LRRQGRNFASGDSRSPGPCPRLLRVTSIHRRFLHPLPMTLCQGRWPHPLPVTLCQGRRPHALQVTLCQGRWPHSLPVTSRRRGEKRLHGYRQLTHPRSFLPLACRALYNRNLLLRQSVKLIPIPSISPSSAVVSATGSAALAARMRETRAASKS